MIKIARFLLGLAALALPAAAVAQAPVVPSSIGPFYTPNWYTGYTPTPLQWKYLLSNKADHFPGGLPLQYGGTGVTSLAALQALIASSPSTGTFPSLVVTGPATIGTTLGVTGKFTAPSATITYAAPLTSQALIATPPTDYAGAVIQGVSAGAGSETMLGVGIDSNTLGNKVALYNGAVMRAGSGPVWNFNSVLTLVPGAPNQFSYAWEHDGTNDTSYDGIGSGMGMNGGGLRYMGTAYNVTGASGLTATTHIFPNFTGYIGPSSNVLTVVSMGVGSPPIVPTVGNVLGQVLSASSIAQGTYVTAQTGGTTGGAGTYTVNTSQTLGSVGTPVGFSSWSSGWGAAYVSSSARDYDFYSGSQATTAINLGGNHVYGLNISASVITPTGYAISTPGFSVDAIGKTRVGGGEVVLMNEPYYGSLGVGAVYTSVVGNQGVPGVRALGSGGILAPYIYFSDALSGVESSGSAALAYIATSSDTMVAGSGGLTGLAINMTNGGGATSGNRQAMQLTMNYAGGTGSNYILGQATYLTVTGPSNPGPSFVSAISAGIFGTWAKAGANYYNEVTGMEVDVGRSLAANIGFLQGIKVVNQNGTSPVGDAGATPSPTDFGIGIGGENINGFFNGISFGLPDTGSPVGSAPPIYAGGTLITTRIGNPFTVNIGIDFLGANFTTYAFVSNAFSISGAGDVVAHSYKAGSNAGVSCSGALTGSAVVTNGIVTHC